MYLKCMWHWHQGGYISVSGYMWQNFLFFQQFLHFRYRFIEILHSNNLNSNYIATWLHVVVGNTLLHCKNSMPFSRHSRKRTHQLGNNTIIFSRQRKKISGTFSKKNWTNAHNCKTKEIIWTPPHTHCTPIQRVPVWLSQTHNKSPVLKLLATAPPPHVDQSCARAHCSNTESKWIWGR